MNCPKCEAHFADIGVVESRLGKGYVRRRRECHKCRHKFTTLELTPKFEIRPGLNLRNYSLVDNVELDRIQRNLLDHFDFLQAMVDHLNLLRPKDPDSIGEE